MCEHTLIRLASVCSYFCVQVNELEIKCGNYYFRKCWATRNVEALTAVIDPQQPALVGG
jgi:hypothetical protein